MGTRMEILGVLNFFLIQWLFVRLDIFYVTAPMGQLTDFGAVRKIRLDYAVIPMTGWFGPRRYLQFLGRTK